jgi:hypothetical protein
MPPYLLDENVSVPIARALRSYDRDAYSLRERGLREVDDYRVLTMAVAEGRTLLTNNHHDFILLHGAWLHWSELWGTSAEHYGILLLNQHIPADVTLRDILAFEQERRPLRNRIYLWTRGGWRELP